MDSHDQEAPPEPEDKPAPDVEAPELSDKADQPEFFDEKFDPATLDDALLPAYQQMRKAFTEKTQSVAEQRKEIEQEQQLLQALRSTDPALQRKAMEALGYDLDGDEPDEEPDEYEDPIESLTSQVQQLQQALEQQQQTAQQAEFQEQLDDYLDEQVDVLENATGRKFDDDELAAIYAQAYMKPDSQGVPDVRGAYEFLYTTVLSKEKKRWVTSKQSDAPGQGQSGSPAVDKSNPKHLRDEMARIIEAGMSDDA